MGPNYIALAIPFFFMLIGLELWVARARGRQVYRLPDAFADMGCGILQQTIALFLGALLLAGYSFFFQHYSLVRFEPGSAMPWLIAFVAVDFLYYWWHRLSHEVNFLWAVHVVHHQSEDYNLAVALRQAIFSGITIWPFYLPMAFLGVPPVVMASMGALSMLYQFWIHTELIGKLGFLERFLNTPSHHRVHHATNPQYLDKNYAAILIIWDRLFGTFEEEREQPIYGITRPLRSFNPLYAQVAEWVELAREARKAPRWADKVRIWFASPAWHPAGVEVPPSPLKSSDYRKYDVDPTAGLRWYALGSLALAVAGTTGLMYRGHELGLPVLALSALLVVLTLVCGAGLLERRAWALPAEAVRLVLLGALGAHALWTSPLRFAVVAAALALAAGLRVARRGSSRAGAPLAVR